MKRSHDSVNSQATDFSENDCHHPPVLTNQTRVSTINIISGLGAGPTGAVRFGPRKEKSFLMLLLEFDVQQVDGRFVICALDVETLAPHSK
jgi:hypothetical protein